RLRRPAAPIAARGDPIRLPRRTAPAPTARRAALRSRRRAGRESLRQASLSGPGARPRWTSQHPAGALGAQTTPEPPPADQRLENNSTGVVQERRDPWQLLFFASI
ncbi:MAG: hypothetical protein RMN24_08165, partial [Anaerolineae bacterium]|nr:hypothetical protein [Anaerolineae bacterium]